MNKKLLKKNIYKQTGKNRSFIIDEKPDDDDPLDIFDIELILIYKFFFENDHK